MSAIGEQVGRMSGPVVVPAGRPAAEGRPLSGLLLSWDVCPDAPGAAACTCGSATGRARLVLAFEECEVVARVERIDPGSGAVVSRHAFAAGALNSRSTTDERGDELLHVEVAGILRATLAMSGAGAVRVLYARTPLLSPPAFPGGWYDRPVATWERR